MTNIFKNLLSKFRIKTKDVFEGVIKQKGQEACGTCGKYVSGWMGGKDDNGNIVRTCLSCCDKENEGIEFKYENNDPIKQVVEYNAYRDGLKVGRTVMISYFTQAQCDEIRRINEELDLKQS